MRSFAWILGIALASGCGSRSLPLADLGGPEGDRGRLDGQVADVVASCAGLEAFAGGVTISPRHALDALFLPDRRGLVLASEDPKTGEAELTLERFAGGRELLGSYPSLRSIEWLVPGSQVLVVEPLSKLQPCSLTRLSLETGASSLVAKGVCSHRVGAGGLALVEACDVDWDGTLRVIPAGSQDLQMVAKDVDAMSVAISRDGKSVAFISEVNHGPGGECGTGVGTLREWSLASGEQLIAKSVVSRSLQYLADGSLLWQSRPGCGTPGGDALVLGGQGKTPKTIASGLAFGYALEGDLYRVSPDGRILIGATESEPGSQLVAVSLDGGATKTVADDLFSFHMTAMAFQPWRFTATGGHLVYTTVTGYPRMGLAALSTTDWSRSLLTEQLFGPVWADSPEGDAVAFVQGTHESASNTLRSASLPGAGGSVELASFKGTIQVPRPHFLPGRRGVLYQQRPSLSVVELRRVSREGGASTLLGSWNKSQLRLLHFEGAYRVDPAGCVVLFDTDTGPEPGTRLRSL